MSQTLHMVRFLRSQEPDQKTGYQNFVVPAQCPSEIVTCFEQIHEALHPAMPRQVLLSFPLISQEITFLCQVLVYPTYGEGRPFLNLKGIIVVEQALRDANLDPIRLMFMADFNNIVRDCPAHVMIPLASVSNEQAKAVENPDMERVEAATEAASGPQTTEPLSEALQAGAERWIAKARQHFLELGTPWRVKQPDQIPIEMLLSSLGGLMRERGKWLSFGFGLPILESFPVDLQVAVFENDGMKAPRYDLRIPRSKRKRLQSLEALTTTLHGLISETPELSSRLWNLGQDILREAEVYLRFADAGERNLEPQKERVQSAYEALFIELQRMQADHIYLEELQLWWDEFLPVPTEPEASRFGFRFGRG